MTTPTHRLVMMALAGTLALSGCGGAGTSTPARGGQAAPAADTRPGVTGRIAPGAIVALAPSEPREFPLPDGPAILDQYSKQFVPALLLARVGQPVEFLNSDEYGHNVIVNRRPTGASVFNVSIDPQQKHSYVFEQPGEYAVSCDIHPGMLATVYVTTTAYAAVADAGGSFQLNDVTPGTYTMTVVLPGGGSTERVVEVGEGRTVLPAR